MRQFLIYTLFCISNVIATTELDDIAQEIVSHSQAEIDLTSLWKKIESIQENYPLTKGQIRTNLPEDEVSMDKENHEVEPEASDTNSVRSKMLLIPLKRETLEAMIPNLAVEVAEAYSKFGMFYLDVKHI